MSINEKEQERLQELEYKVRAIQARAHKREKAGRDSTEVAWQATLEMMLLLMDMTLQNRAGQLLPVQIANEEEAAFYAEILEKVDLPPDTNAVLYTPTAFKNMPFPRDVEAEVNGISPWQRNAYTIIISDTRDHDVVIQVSLPGLEYSGIDVFDDGVHIANYNYHTVNECVTELSGIVWNYFEPRDKWTDDQIVQYTEAWFSKNLDTDLENVPLHQKYSYVHNPEVLKMTPSDSVFKLVTATVPKEYDSLEEFIGITNELNEEWEFGNPVVSLDGINQGKESECKALLDRITVEIDQSIDKLRYVEGVKLPNPHEDKYKRAFLKAAKLIYLEMTGQRFPETITYTL